jgi:protein-tyrosine kinase
MGQKPKAKIIQTPAATLLPATIHLDFEAEMISLNRNIDARLSDTDAKVIQFISAREGEGTSTIVREFARVAAKKIGKSVFLLDVDQHNPRQHVFFRISPECDWEEIAGKSDLDMWGCQVPADAEVVTNSHSKTLDPLNFYSPSIKDFWNLLRQRYDLVLIDSAPLAISTEGVEIARRVDGVVLVVEAEKTRWQVVENLKEKILNAGGLIIGVVFNKRRFYIPDAIYNRL